MGAIISKVRVIPSVTIFPISRLICYEIIHNSEYQNGYLELIREEDDTIDKIEFDILWGSCQIVDKKTKKVIDIINLIKKELSYTNKELQEKENREAAITKLRKYLQHKATQYYYSLNSKMYSMSEMGYDYIDFKRYQIYKPRRKNKEDIYKQSWGSLGSISY